MPAKICGQRRGQDDAADRSRPRDAVRARRVHQRRLDAAHAVDRVQQDREEAEERDERDLLRVADRPRSRTIEIGISAGGGIARQYSMCGIATRAPSARARAGSRARRRGRRRWRSRAAMRSRLGTTFVPNCGEEPELLELDEDRRQPRELRVVRVHRPELPGDEDQDGHRDLGADPERPVGARAHRSAASVRCEGCQRSTRRSTAAIAKWIATPRKPVASASAYSTVVRPYASA